MSCFVQNPVVFVICLRETMNSVCFSPISVQPLTVRFDCWFKIEEFPNKMAISSSGFQRQIILSQKTDRIRASVMNFGSHTFLFCLQISSSPSLMLGCTVPKFHFGLPRMSSFTLSLRVLPKAQLQQAFSLHVGALSL